MASPLPLPPSLLSLLLLPILLFSTSPSASGTNVSYDRRSLIIDGRRRLIISASIHYPRSVPAMWPGLVALAKDGGADAVETYVFWNGHELSPGDYYFEERFDLVKFVKIVRDAGMYLILRIGPFVAAEWNFGGVPVWLHYVPGTVFRSDNEPFKNHMKNFTTFIVYMMKQEKLFASQGGPIILAQIENEYGDLERFYGDGGKSYAMWAASMALAQDIDVPWMMCQQYDAPDPVINTCNSFYCDQFTPNSMNKPKFWTENWPGWFKTFGARNPHRPVEDVAFSVARFFQKGGSLQNYYMYHGGTNFGRTSGGPFITTSYDYDAPIDEYGLARFPKWAHLKELHKAIKLCENGLLFSEPTVLQLGPLQEASVFVDSSGGCSAFLVNADEVGDIWVSFKNKSFHLPSWSISILPDCKTVAFNTAKVRSQTAIMEMVPENLKSNAMTGTYGPTNLQWYVFTEETGVWGKADFEKVGFVDHINTTKDSTDYLWYTTSFHVEESDEFLMTGKKPILTIESKGHALYAFINHKLEGTASGNGSESMFTFETPITLKAGQNDIFILSLTVGLRNAGPFYEWAGAGITSVRISDLRNGSMDLSSHTWVYKIGLEGEHKSICKTDGSTKVKWISTLQPPINQPLTWYKVVVDPPSGNEPLGLDMVYMGKGQAWLNGKPIGRYWLRTAPSDGCPSACNYKGKFLPDKCDNGCGEPTQRWYHVPRSWFLPSGNTLVFFEEKGGDPTKISFSKRRVTSLCSLISEDYPPMNLDSWVEQNKEIEGSKPTLHLMCRENSVISSIKFASYGNPSGTCGLYKHGSCHYPNSVSFIERACLNKSECMISLSKDDFPKYSCPGVTKSLAVEATCS